MSPTARLVTRVLLFGVFVTGLVAGVLFGDLGSGFTLTPYLAFAAIGLLLTARRPQAPVGWLFLVVAALAGISGLQNSVLEFATGRGHADAPYALFAAWLSNITWLPLIVTSTVLTMLLFPDGLPSRRWRGVYWVTIATTVSLIALFAFTPQLTLGDGSTYPNPLHPATEWGVVVNITLVTLLGLLLLCALLATVSVVVRYWHAAPTERAQIKWFAFAAVLFFVTVPLSSTLLNSSFLADVVFTVVATFIPLACGVAILRYRLYDIDRIISRTTSYAIVTGLVLLTYAAVVAAASRLAPDSSSLGIAVATLAGAAVARPLLRRVQGAVDRRFNRARYNSQHTVDAFGRRLRHEVHPEAVTAELVAAVALTMEPATVRVWRP